MPLACIWTEYAEETRFDSGAALVGGLEAGGHSFDGSATRPHTGLLLVAARCADAAARTIERAVAGDPSGRLVVAIEPEGYTRERALCWIRAGAHDVFPAAPEAVESIDLLVRRWARVDREVDGPRVRENLIGDSPAWRSSIRRIVEVALFGRMPTLICGETGTGKELAVRLLHAVDPRESKGKLVLQDCSTVQPELSGSELFGHRAGAYTGADESRLGAFALADGGTLFLDEVGELPAAQQAMLLRAIQEGVYRPLGSDTWLETRFRLVCATHRDLERDVAAGRFREDLYHRLAGATIELPPLRERRSDIEPLARHFLRAATAAGPSAPPAFDAAVLEVLAQREYSGNVRELRQLVHEIAMRHAGGPMITLGCLPEHVLACDSSSAREEPPGLERAARRAAISGLSLREIRRRAELAAIQAAFEHRGSWKAAARSLGMTERALQMRRKAERDEADPPAA